MKLSSFFTGMLVVLMTAVMSMSPVEAKKLGGGMSFGKSYDYKRSAAPTSTPAKPAAAPASNATARPGAPARSGMMGGMLGGLLAGGLLGALFFGGAFDGINFMDILLVAGIGFLIFKFMKGRAASAPAWQRQEAAATAGSSDWQPASAPSAGRESGEAMMRRQAASAQAGGFAIPDIGSGLQGETLSVLPVWFDESAFMAEANNHYRTLQAHWDAGQMDDIRTYVTPEMFNELKLQHDALTRAPETDVVELHSQLLDLIKDGNNVVAAILFSGLIREDGAEAAEPFAEIWHVTHAADTAAGDWLLAGIIQHDL